MADGAEARRHAVLALIEEKLRDVETLDESIDRRTAELVVLHDARAQLEQDLAALAARLGKPRRR